MSDQVVSTVFKAKDKLSSVFKRMGKGADKFGNGADKAFKKASRGARRFDRITKSILKASVIQKSFSLLTRGITEATTSFVSFDDALFSASAKFKDVDLTTKKGLETFKKLGEAARENGRITQFTAAQSAQALDFLALAGFNAQQSMAALPGLADLATSAGIDDFARVVDIASDSLGAFGLATKNAAQLEKNLTRISDVFSKTQATTNTNIEALFEAVSKGAPAFTAAGQSLETFNSLIGVMANSSVKGGEAGTILRNMMLRLANPTKQALKVMGSLRITTKDSNDNFRNAIDILADFEKGLKGMGTAARSQALSVVFGARAITGVNILLKEGTKKLKVWEKGLESAGGTSKTIAGIMRQSIGNRLKTLASAATEVAFKFLDAFKVKGVNAIDSFTKTLRLLDMKPVVDGITTVIGLITNLFTVAKSLLTIMSPLIAAWTAYKLVLLSTLIVTKGYALFAITLGAIRNGTVLLTAAQWALNIAMKANPIGLIVAGVTLLVSGIALLITKWDVVKKSFVSGGKAILAIFTSIWKIAKGIFSFGLGSILGAAGLSGGNSQSSPQGNGAFAPPNKKEANAQASRFEGLLKFENMPDNVSFESKTFGAPPIQLQGLGAN